MNNWDGLTVKEPRLYNIWNGMIQRCENPKRSKYSDYGGRGISVCDDWHDFSVFVEWAKANGYEDGLTIDRINVNGNYEPVNCRWATIIQQSNNKRTSVQLSCFGVTGTIAQWGELLEVSPYTIYEWANVHGTEYAEKRVIETVRNGGIAKQVRTKNCVKCGKEFTHPANTPGAKYCPDCKKIADREKFQRYNRKRKLRGAEVADGN